MAPTPQQHQPWWSKIFYDLYNLGTKDPEGNYWKPDVNVQLPGNYPIQALLPGTVTSLQNTGYGQDMATISLDQPLNSSATHTFYEHMSNFASGLKVGQHVSSGQLIGYNNPSGQVPLGFGLYSGDVYGSGPAWNQLQQDLAPGGAGMLNPQPLLNAVQSGKSLSGAPCSNCADGQWCILGNCVDVPGITGAKQAADTWSGVAGQTGHILQNLTNPDFWIRVGIGIGAIILVIWGLQQFIKNTGPVVKSKQAAADLLGQVPFVGQSAKDVTQPSQPSQPSQPLQMSQPSQQQSSRPAALPTPPSTTGAASTTAASGEAGAGVGAADLAVL